MNIHVTTPAELLMARRLLGPSAPADPASPVAPASPVTAA
jgi:hypothetical protein